MLSSPLPVGLSQVCLDFRAPPFSRSVLSVPSDREVGKAYTLDLNAQTCTCPDFMELRSNATKPGELGRLCKHLIRALNERHAFDTANKWVRVIVNAGYGAPYVAWEVGLPTAKPMLVTLGNSRDWLNVFAHLKRKGERYTEASGPIEQFGWSLGEHRWSYGQGPPGASEIRPFLIQLDNMDFDALLRGANQSKPPQLATTCLVGTAPGLPVPPAKTNVTGAARSAPSQGLGKPRGALGRILGWLHR